MLIGHQPKEFLLAVEALTVSFDGFKAVNDLSFYVEENEIRVIIGPNGAGKTTVLDLICGKTRATSGSIQFRGKELTKLKENEIVQAGVGRKFQTPSVFEDLTVFENLEISYPRGRTVFGSLAFQRDAAVRERVEEVAEMIFLKDRLDTFADQLSHGQKQWLEIGMLLIQDPDLLMLDEPVAGMSVSERAKTAELLNRIIKDRSVLVIEHDMKFVEDIAHKVTVLHQGQILSEGTMEKVKNDPKVIEVYLGHIKGQCMLAISDLHVAYGQSEVLHGLNVSVAPNEIVAIMGRNGMGKTTLMKSLMGILPTKSGSVTMNGTELSALPSYERVAKGLAYVPQGRMIFSTMTVKENIETGLVVSGGSEVPEDIYELFPVLLEMKGRRGGNLSGGQQQQLAIARALATKPKVLLLDEPTEGIQPSIIKDMARTLKRIRDERGLSIVVSEQVLSFALDIADRVLVIENGEIVRDDPRDSVDAAQVSKYLSV